jgi:hypothetical protein
MPEVLPELCLLVGRNLVDVLFVLGLSFTR